MDAIDLKALRKLRENDLRARQMVDAAVAHALREQGEPREHDYRSFACDVATIATTALLKMIYESDGEIGRLRIERDHYRDLAWEALSVRPVKPLVLKPGDPPPIPM